MTSELNNRNVVRVSHELNHFKGGYTPLELDFIYAFISTIKMEDHELKDYSLSLSELEHKLERRLQLSKIEYIFDSLVTKSFKINNEKKLTVYSFFSMLDYDKEEQILTVSFNPKLKPHLLQLERYAKGNLRYILQLRGEYSKRIYMLLSQWQTARKVTYALDDLRVMLAIPENYKYSNIKQKVLLKAQSELKRKAPFHFSFEAIKTGKKVTEICFKLIENNLALDALKDDIKENHVDQRLFEHNGKMIHCDDGGKLYTFDKQGDRGYFANDFEHIIWKSLLKNKDKLAIYTTNLLNFDV